MTILPWHCESDSYGNTAWFWGIHATYHPAEEAIFHGLGGSTFEQIVDRVVAKPELRANPLVIWDGAANGHVMGSIQLEMRSLAALAAFKNPHKNWLIVAPVVVRDLAGSLDDQLRLAADLEIWKSYISEVYGPHHLFDPVPVINSFAKPDDALIVAAGLVPQSVTFDGLHPTNDVKYAVSAALTAMNGPMDRVRYL